jgi:hypothetical protein
LEARHLLAAVGFEDLGNLEAPARCDDSVRAASDTAGEIRIAARCDMTPSNLPPPAGVAISAALAEGEAGSIGYPSYFDFGTKESPVALGYERITEHTGYSTEQGYGWQSGTIRSTARKGWGALDADFNYTAEGTFAVDLPLGFYSVDLILGDRGSKVRDNVGVYLEGTLQETVSSKSRQVLSRHFDVHVTDGQLTLTLSDLGGKDKYVCVQALRITRSGMLEPDGFVPLWPTHPDLPGAWFSEPVRDANGFFVYTVESQYQAAPTKIRVLLPSNFEWGKMYSTVYVLPVEAGSRQQFGDGLVTARNLGLHQIHDAIFVAPTFSATPWYADHVTNIKIWQETYFRTVVVPFVELRYPTPQTAEGRLLLGFSKSGYGAFSMFLRHPDDFGRAAVWDAPLAMSNPSSGYDYQKILGSKANFPNYQITALLQQRAPELAARPVRLILRGYSYDSARRDHAAIDGLMTQLGIPHDYAEGLKRRHVWHSGWMQEAVALLFS